MNNTFVLLENSSAGMQGDTLLKLNCPSITSEEWELIGLFTYYAGGVVVCCVAIPGIILNILAICALSASVTAKNNFNQLLISLFVFDSVFLILHVLDTFVRIFQFSSRIFVIVFPHFIFPVRTISFTASIYMTVGIAHERYIAVRDPITHRQALGSAKLRRINLAKYLVSIIICAIVINVPKFFEADLVWKSSPITNTTDNQTG